MNELLKYPFDGELILKKRKRIKRELLENTAGFMEKNIAVLGGSTTHDIKDILELFLLNNKIKPTFYESEYGQYWQDAVFENEELEQFQPDIIVIHTTNRNIMDYPSPEQSKREVDELLMRQFRHFEVMWNRIEQRYQCAIIQNNFEYPYFRYMGNMDASDFRGRVNYITKLNLKFYEYAETHQGFYINDLNYLSADYGLQKWSDPFYWHMYKYALCMPAIPFLAFSLSNIIKSLYGKNKKGFILDLDNTLWGGVIGDDGIDNIELGQETSEGQVYSEFQQYLKDYKKYGILLAVDSKNDYENAVAGLNHPDSILKPDDFVEIKANWEPKNMNVKAIADDLCLLPESFVFVDDNPAERAIVEESFPEAGVPDVGRAEHYIGVIDRCGFFEMTSLSADDMKRNVMYKENAQRKQMESGFQNYEDYLNSLEMRATIASFDPIHTARIAQLTNKSNQFNLTTKRYTSEEIERAAKDSEQITLYGKLADKFGDNGVVTVVIGNIKGKELHLGLWLMSCRVLKRNMEYAMMDKIVDICQKRGIKVIKGYYIPTVKNAMVRDFYQKQGFEKESEDAEGNSVWRFIVDDNYKNKNSVIKIETRIQEGEK
ncbi:MAG: HAD-IIIC family phosphatase [Suilimivivens sp.]